MYGSGAVTGMMQIIIVVAQVKTRKVQVPAVPVCCAAALGAVMVIVVVLLTATGAILVLGTAVAAFVLRRSNYPIALFLSYPFTLCLEENV